MKANAAFFWLALLACGDSRPAAAPAPTEPMATLVIEPPTLLIGEVASVEIRTATAPGSRVLPYAPPRIDGVWLLGAEVLDTERTAARWIHRTRIRVRPRALGSFEWPASRIEVAAADGTRSALRLPARRFEVVSAEASAAGRVEPFGLRPPAEDDRARGGTWLLPFAAGATAAGFMAAGLRARARNRRHRLDAGSPPASEPGASAAPDLAGWVDGELRAAAALLPRDPPAAAGRAARTLKTYIQRRFQVDLSTRTTLEIAAQNPPLSLHSRWPELVRMLRALDAERFPPPGADGTDRRVARSLREIRGFVEASPPPRTERR